MKGNEEIKNLVIRYSVPHFASGFRDISGNERHALSSYQSKEIEENNSIRPATKDSTLCER